MAEVAPGGGAARLRSRPVLKLALLVAILVAVVLVARQTPLGAYFTREGALGLIAWVGAHPWAPLVFVTLYAAATALALPGTILTLAGGAIFGFWWGVALNLIAANLGASAAFWIARSLGRDGVRHLIGSDSAAMQRLDRVVGRHGMQGLLTLRLMPVVPFNVLNFGSGLLPLPWRSYALATLIGIVPGCAVYTYFADALLQGSQEAGAQAFVRVLVAGALLLALSLLPALLRRLNVRLPGMGTGMVALALGSGLAFSAPPASAQSALEARGRSDVAGEPEVRASPAFKDAPGVAGVADKRGADQEPAAFDHSPLTAVLAGVVADDGVRYAHLAEDPTGLDAYLALLESTAPDDVERLPREERLAFWINAYNACMLKRVVAHYPIQPARGLAAFVNAVAGRPANSVWQIDDVFTGPHCNVAGRERSQDEIEHEIIRPMGDPRIHFAVNCAAVSCPPLVAAAYDGATLDVQLDDRVRAFMADPRHFRVSGDAGERTVHLNMVLDWFNEDFGGHEGIRRFLAGYADPVQAEALRDPRTGLSFVEYDWRLNDSPG